MKQRTKMIGLVTIAIIVTALVTTEITAIIPRYESTFHESSLRLAADLLSKGETNRVLQALTTYNGIAATGSTYRAAMQMWIVLNNPERKQ